MCADDAAGCRRLHLVLADPRPRRYLDAEHCRGGRLLRLLRRRALRDQRAAAGLADRGAACGRPLNLAGIGQLLLVAFAWGKRTGPRLFRV